MNTNRTNGNQQVATLVDPADYGSLRRHYGEKVFVAACAAAKTSPLSMNELCYRIAEAQTEALIPAGVDIGWEPE